MLFALRIQHAYGERVIFLVNQNLRTDSRWSAKQIRKSARKFIQVAKSRDISRIYSQLTYDQLVSGDLCWVKNLRRLAYEFELDRSQRKSSQVGGQTKHKLNASRKLALISVDLRVRVARAGFMRMYEIGHGAGVFSKNNSRY